MIMKDVHITEAQRDLVANVCQESMPSRGLLIVFPDVGQKYADRGENYNWKQNGIHLLL